MRTIRASAVRVRSSPPPEEPPPPQPPVKGLEAVGDPPPPALSIGELDDAVEDEAEVLLAGEDAAAGPSTPPPSSGFVEGMAQDYFCTYD